MADAAEEKPARQADGKWLPGHCPNPKGRPRKVEVNEEFLLRVETLASATPTKFVATLLGMTEKTFHNLMDSDARVLTAVQVGRANAVHDVSNTVFTRAKEGEAWAAKWFLGNFAGMSDGGKGQTTIEVNTSAQGAPSFKVITTIDGNTGEVEG